MGDLGGPMAGSLRATRGGAPARLEGLPRCGLGGAMQARSAHSGSVAAQATAPPVRFSAVYPASLRAVAAWAERPPTWHATTIVVSRGSSSTRAPSCPSGMFTPIG